MLLFAYVRAQGCLAICQTNLVKLLVTGYCLFESRGLQEQVGP